MGYIMILGTQRSRNNSFCKLNLRMDGTDGGTTFTDSSPAGRAITDVNATTITSDKVFGTAAGNFVGSSSQYIYAADSNDFYTEDKKWTISFRIKRKAVNSRQVICGQSKSDASSYCHWIEWYYGSAPIDNKLKYVATGMAAPIYANTAITSTTTWYDIAITYDGTNLKFWLNGIYDGGGAISISWPDVAYQFAVGRGGEYNGLYLTAIIDQFMVHKGALLFNRNYKSYTKAA